MRPYEVVLILESTAEDDVVQAMVDKVRDVVSATGGSLGQVDKWGRRRFAYELKHRWEGNYTLVEITAAPQTIAELDRVLHLADEVVRHKIVRIPDSVAGRAKPASNPEPAAVAAESTGASA